MAEYFLAPHVHFCCRGDAFVFLDLRQDDYMLVDGKTATAFKKLLDHQPASANPQLAPDLQEMLDGGLLTTDSRAGKRLCAARAELALELLLDPEQVPPSWPRIPHVARFISACTTSAMRLRWGHIQHTVNAVANRKRRRSSNAPLDVDKARELTAAFKTLRSAFPRNYLCLFDSLALLEFLASYDVYPTWVFGVRLEPWGAHCWVQEGQFIFNEGVEEAASYTPIMTI
jgi:hypothetical protein